MVHQTRVLMLNKREFALLDRNDPLSIGARTRRGNLAKQYLVSQSMPTRSLLQTYSFSVG